MSNSIKDPHMLKSQPCDLLGTTRPVAHLTQIQRNEMFGLMNRYFLTSRAIFETDLAEKDWVILLTDPLSGQIKGFSTVKRIDLEDKTAIFSGDTIIHADYRFSTALPIEWARLAFSVRDQIKENDPDRPVYWFLITSGYKTYRYLPLFFKTFYPRYDRPTPADVQAIMDALATVRYGNQYDPTAGVIRLRQSTPLRAGVAEIHPRRLQNPHIAFYTRANPGHAAGDELVSLAAIERDNLTRAGVRMVSGGA